MGSGCVVKLTRDRGGEPRAEWARQRQGQFLPDLLGEVELAVARREVGNAASVGHVELVAQRRGLEALVLLEIVRPNVVHARAAKVELADAQLDRVWMTLASFPEEPGELVRTVLRVFWDGEASPSIEVPVGDFFGVGFGLRRNFVSLPLQMSPEDGKGMNCWFPMPFADGARFEVANEGQSRRVLFFYVDYESYASLPGDLGRFHAQWRRENPTAGTAADKGYTRADFGYDDERPSGPGNGLRGPWKDANLDGARNYVILDVRGNGQYVGCVLNVDVFERQVNDWYGEGDDMIFIDDEPWPPRLHGTGTEEPLARQHKS